MCVAILVAVHFSTLATADSSHHEIQSHQPIALAPAIANAAPANNALLQEFSAAFESAAAKVNPSVVPILSEHKVSANHLLVGPNGGQLNPFEEDFFRHFFGFGGQQPEETLHSLGSGVIVSEDGYILTNSHVVQDADKLTVIVGDDNKRYKATVVGSDPQTDLAVVKIDAEKLPAATLGDSSELRVGQWVIAVGNPLEMLHSVTAGIISATGRSSVGLADYEDFIQTDASINPGNSGGALADLDGRVIGINTAIASPSGGNVGVGFAIPMRMAQTVMNDLITDGKISRGYLGVVIQNIDDDLAKGLGLSTTSGALVGDVTRGEAGDKAGLERGDVITSFEGQTIKDSAQLRNLVAATKPGTRVEMKIIREGHEKEVDATLGERPTTAASWTPGSNGNSAAGPKLGFSVRDLDQDAARQLGYEGEQGALVTNVQSGGPAEEAGLRRGDLIERAGNIPIQSAEDLQQALDQAPSGGVVVLLVRREKTTFFMPIQVP